MVLIGYIGTHRKDSLTARLGWVLVRLAQAGDTYRRVTHCDAMLSGIHADATIGGASVREGGVRIKRTELTPGSWIVLDVPAWDSATAWRRIVEAEGQPYDWRGAAATAFWFLPHSRKAWFCSELLAHAAGLIDPHRYKPSNLFAVAASLPGTRDITAEVFRAE
jgi:hypothetical protein